MCHTRGKPNLSIDVSSAALFPSSTLKEIVKKYEDVL